MSRRWLTTFLLLPLTVLGAAISPAAAGAASDLVIVESRQDSKGGVQAQVKVRKGAGPSVEDFILGSPVDLVYLLDAGVADVQVEPFFDPAAYPGAPPLIRVTFNGSTVKTSDAFLGTVGHSIPDAPGILPGPFRDELFVQYEVDIDGVAIHGDLLGVIGPFLAGADYVTVFNATQQIKTPGAHQVTYRLLTRKDYPDQPAAVYEIVFPVTVIEND